MNCTAPSGFWALTFTPAAQTGWMLVAPEAVARAFTSPALVPLTREA